MADRSDAVCDELAGLSLADNGSWLDITRLVDRATGDLASGETVRAPGFTLFDAMTSIEVMDARLDMGMLSADDARAIADWDFGRVLTLRQALWVALWLLRCEMTWHMSASLVQTLYTCNYFTCEYDSGGRETSNPARDLVLYPLVVATGACARRVWDEYARENLFSDEDVQFGAAPPRFFDECSARDAERLLDRAQAHLQQHGNEQDRAAVQSLLALVAARRHWLRALVLLDARSVDAAARELDAVRLAWPADAGDAVRGAFDRKCMRRYASAAPIKPRALLAGADAAAALERMARDLRDVLRALFAAGSAEHAAYAFQALALRAPAPLPFVRSAAATAFLGDACVRGREPLDAFVRRAVLEAAPAPAPALASLLRNDGARVVADWLRTQCQNAPRQRRVALKYLGGWDALQAACEQADAQTHADAFCTASWAYHMKLQLLAAALLGGVRMRVYADHELPALFCCAAHALDAHVALLDRMRAHASPERAARLRRWRALASAQHALAQAQWLVAHALERLRVFRAPWWPRPGDASRLAACARLEGTRARRARFALRFRALAALGSPPPLTFDAWCAAQQQLDACPLAELFDHAARTLARARDALERERRLRHDDASPVAAAWDQACEPLARVMVANAVALARLQQGGVLERPELHVAGAVAARHRSAVLQADVDLAAGKSLGRRRKKDVERARGWLQAVDQLASDGLRASWTADVHPHWPVYTFGP